MGLKNSAANYQDAMNAIVCAIRFKFRDMFEPSPALRKIWAWLDDFMMSAGGKCFASALRKSAEMLGIFLAVA